MDRKFSIDFFELAFLAESCIPPVPIARGMFFQDLSKVYYNQMTDGERARLFDWTKDKLDMNNDDCKVFYHRFNPENQYNVEALFEGKKSKHKCFKVNDRYYTKPDTSIVDECIKKITHIVPFKE